MYNESAVRKVILGDGSVRESQGEGTIVIKRRVNGQWYDGFLEKVLYMPDFNKNLYATSVATENGLRVIFENNQVEIEHKQSHSIVAQGKKVNSKLCILDFEVVLPNVPQYAAANACCSKTLHENLGHVNKQRLRKMLKDNVIEGAENVTNENFFCEGCVYGKMHRLPHYRQKEEEEDKCFDIGECLYMDLCGPMSVSLGGSKYFMLVKDRKSSHLFVYFLKTKNEAVNYFKKLYQYIATSINKQVKMVRCDNGLEFCNKELTNFLSDKGAISGTSAPHCQQQNGRIERENRIVVESARSMIHQNNEPKHLWAEAVKITPYELWHGKKPNILHMRPFGAVAFVLVPKIYRAKFDANATNGILVGYQDTTDKNYRICNETRNKVTVARDVVFKDSGSERRVDFITKISPKSTEKDVLEKQFISATERMDISDYPDNYDHLDMSFSESESKEDEQVQVVDKKSNKRKLCDTSMYSPPNLRVRSSIKKPKRYEQANFVELIDPVEPKTYEEAVSGPYEQQC